VVDLHQELTVTPGPLLWLDTRAGQDGKNALHLGDRTLRFPAECAPFVTAVLRSPTTFSGSTLGGHLDDESRRAVLNRLATEGVVGG
jgi:hypothetical protein